MLKIMNEPFQISSAELNLKKRNYQGQTIVSLQFQIGFFPKQVKDTIIGGMINIVIDVTDLTSFQQIEHQTYQENGKTELALQKNGNWEYQTYYHFTLSLGQKKGNQIEVTLEEQNKTILLQIPITIVSIYSINSNEETFDLTDCYEIPIRKKIGNKEILKYIIKEK